MFFAKQTLALTVLFAAALPSFSAPVSISQSLSTRQNQRIPAIGSGPQVAKDGSVILEDEVTVAGLNLRFKVSAPQNALVSKVGAAEGDLGVNVLFHGDGGQSFFDFPNQGVNNGLMGVALLSPDPQLRWGGSGKQSSLDRPDGPAHSAAINAFMTQVLPKLVNFSKDKVFMEGISGGSLLLSGFLLPTFGASLNVQGAVIGCGGLPPQVVVKEDITNTRIHWQSSTDDLLDLQEVIPQAIKAYEQLATKAGLNTAQINKLQTADASPNGGHCEFDQRDFVSGVQLLTSNFGSIIAGNGALNGVKVTNGVVGNENLFVKPKGKAAQAPGGLAGGVKKALSFIGLGAKN